MHTFPLPEKSRLTLPKSFCRVLTSAKGIRNFWISFCSYSRARQDSETWIWSSWCSRASSTRWKQLQSPRKSAQISSWHDELSDVCSLRTPRAYLPPPPQPWTSSRFLQNKTHTLGSTWGLFPWLHYAFNTSAYKSRVVGWLMNNDRWIPKPVRVAYFEVMLRHLPGRTENNHQKFQDRGPRACDFNMTVPNSKRSVKLWNCLYILKLTALFYDVLICWDYIASAMDEWIWNTGWVIRERENQSHRRKICSSATSLTTNTTCSGLGSNKGPTETGGRLTAWAMVWRLFGDFGVQFVDESTEHHSLKMHCAP